MDNKFESNGGEQNIAQGSQAIGRQINTYGIPPEVFAEYAGKLSVTEAALSSFFNILGENQVPLHDIDKKLREIATNHKELLRKLQHDTKELSRKPEGGRYEFKYDSG